MRNEPGTLVRIAEFGIWQFFVLTLIAMLIYPGGTLHDTGRETYSFLNNFFSDLGRTQDFRGQANPSRWIFTVTVTLVGLSMMAFFSAVPAIFQDRREFRTVKFVAVFFGVIAGLGYVGVAFTPYDILMDWHGYSVKSGFSAFFLMSILLTWMIYKSAWYPNIYGHIFLFFDVLLLGYIYLLFFGPDARESIQAMHLQVISQKILIYSQIICMLIQMRGARMVLRQQQGAAD